MKQRNWILVAALAVVGGTTIGCGQQEGVAAAPLSEAAQRGQVVYNGVCIACHNTNPALDGALGPGNAHASRELVEAKVVRGEYPPGYTPKRPSRAMPAFPHLADKVDDLTAWLTECCPAK
ncbi:MAG: cytochrome c [Myxococcota bacterium]|jgi:mono/diheme cytochrome c family protein|nr:cytochrome c [Myxococcota bacterium]